MNPADEERSPFESKLRQELASVGVPDSLDSRIASRRRRRHVRPTGSLTSLAAFVLVVIVATAAAYAALQPRHGQAPGGALAPLGPVCLAPGSVELVAVSGASPRDVWAVGATIVKLNEPWQTLAERWTGARWQVVPTPSPGTEYNMLLGVAVVGPGDAWAVGFSQGRSGERPLIEHWDGRRWVDVPSPSLGLTGLTASASLTAVSASGPADAWAVGWEANGGAAQQPITEHWNGTTWTLVASPRLPMPDPRGPVGAVLTAIDDISLTDAWAVGYYTGNNRSQALIEHWDGQSWLQSSPPSVEDGVSSLTGVVSSATGRLWATGAPEGPSSYYPALVVALEGGHWQVTRATGTGHLYAALAGMAIDPGGERWAVGYTRASTQAPERALIVRSSSHGWTTVSAPKTGPGGSALVGVTAISQTDAWAVGSVPSLTCGGPGYPLIEHWNGHRWEVSVLGKRQ